MSGPELFKSLNYELWDISPERLIPSARFTPEAIKAVESLGGVILTFSGASITDQNKVTENLIIDNSNDRGLRSLAVPARQYAVFSDSPLIPDSLNETYEEQRKLLVQETKAARKTAKNDSFEFVIPSAPVATELILKHYLERKELHINPLIGTRKATRTSTPVGKSNIHTASVGYFNPQRGLQIYSSSIEKMSPEVGLLRVATPTSGI